MLSDVSGRTALIIRRLKCIKGKVWTAGRRNPLSGTVCVGEDCYHVDLCWHRFRTDESFAIVVLPHVIASHDPSLRCCCSVLRRSRARERLSRAWLICSISARRSRRRWDLAPVVQPRICAPVVATANRVLLNPEGIFEKYSGPVRPAAGLRMIDFDKLLARIYEAGAVPDMWPDALSAISDLVGAQGAILFTAKAGSHPNGLASPAFSEDMDAYFSGHHARQRAYPAPHGVAAPRVRDRPRRVQAGRNRTSEGVPGILVSARLCLGRCDGDPGAERRYTDLPRRAQAL